METATGGHATRRDEETAMPATVVPSSAAHRNPTNHRAHGCRESSPAANAQSSNANPHASGCRTVMATATCTKTRQQPSNKTPNGGSRSGFSTNVNSPSASGAPAVHRRCIARIL